MHFFGHPESPLFGVYHAPRGKNKANAAAAGQRAVLICPPIGQEYIRTHWSLRLLATQLSRKGIHVLRMDYHGIGDSVGSVEQVNSLGIWTNNIEMAIDDLKKQSGAQTVMLIGQRFGATMSALVSNKRNDVNSVVLWEPVLDGNSYLESLRGMHSEMLDLWVCKMQTPNDEQQEEILGSRYHRQLLNQIEAVQIDVGTIEQPQLIVDVEQQDLQYSHPEPSLQKVIWEENEGSWDDLSVLETARLRPMTTRTIVKTVDDMFTRLVGFDALNLNTSNLTNN